MNRLRPYFRVMRLHDQYASLAAALAAGVYLHETNGALLFWAIATVCISIVIFMVNELVDRHDTDRYSWNTKSHLGQSDNLNMRIVYLMLITFSIIGVCLAHSVGLFWWSIAALAIGLAYSIPPLRFKAHLGVDILAQLAGIFIPFLAFISLYQDISQLIDFTIIMCMIIWGALLPYQLADYQADVKSGLRNTHVVMGMRWSLYFGLVLSIGGIMLYFITQLYLNMLWSIVIVPLGLYAAVQYMAWLRQTTETDQMKAMQQYVHRARIASQLIVPYLLLILWLQQSYL